MPDQKIDNLLNLAMDATPQERRKSGNLNVGYDPATRLWDVIIKYSGPESGLAGNGIQVVPLLGGYAVVTLPESEIDKYSHRVQVEFMEKPKRLYFELFYQTWSSLAVRQKLPASDIVYPVTLLCNSIASNVQFGNSFRQSLMHKNAQNTPQKNR